MSSKLVDMELDEISLVKKGANQFSTVSIAKSLSGEEEEMEELFFEDGSPADVDDLELGDVVFTEDGEAFEVTEDDDDEDGEEFGKAAGYAGARMLGRAGAASRSAARKKNISGIPVRNAVASAKGAASGARSGGKKLYARAAGGVGSAAEGVRHGAKFGFTDSPGKVTGAVSGAFKRTGAKVKGGWNAGSMNREIEGSIRRGTLSSGARQNKMGYAPNTGEYKNPIRNAAQNISQNRTAYGVGAAGVGVAGAGAGAYEYNRRKNVAKSLREEFGKALSDEDRDDVISKAFDEIESLQYAATEAMEIAKSEQEARVYSEYVAIAKTYTLPFEDEDVAMAMMEAEANLSEEACAIIAKSFELASNLIDNEIGFEGVGYDSPTMASIEDTLQEFGKSGDPDSVVALMEANPGMYDAYLAEQRG